MAAANIFEMGGLGEIFATSAARAPWGWALLATVIVGLWRGLPAIKALSNARETGLLAARAEDMDDMRKRIATLEGRLDQQRVEYEAQLAIQRHRANNIAGCLDALLLMLELRPDQVPEAVSRIKTMRAEQTHAEAAEKGAVAGAKIIAAGAPAQENAT